MIKCLLGEEKELINKYIKKIIDENEYEVIKYGYSDENINLIANELSYSNFFGMKKLVIINDANFLSKKDENILSKIIPNITDMDIILTYNAKASERNELFKFLKKENQVVEFPKLTKYNIENQIRQDFVIDGYKIDNYSIKEIISISGADYSIVSKEIEKLKYYKINDKLITKEDVDNIVNKNNDDVMFKLVDAINERDTKKIVEYYSVLISDGIDPLMLISMLGGSFRLLLQIKLLLSDKKSMSEIEKILSVNKYRLDIMAKKSYHFSIEDLVDSLSNLFELEYEIKSKNEDKNSLVLLFLLSKYGN